MSIFSDSAAGAAGGGLVGAGIGAATSLFNNFLSGNNAKKQYKYARKLAEQQQEYNVANYHMQHEDSVDDILQSAQRKKQSLKDAGYSIALADGQYTPLQGAAAASVGDAGLPSAPNVQTFGMSPSDILLSAQLANTQANTAKTQSETEVAQTQRDMMSKQLDLLTANGDALQKATIADLQASVAYKGASSKAQDALVKYYDAAISKMDAEKVRMDVQNMCDKLRTQADVDKVAQDIRESQARINEVFSRIALNSAQIDVLNMTVDKIDAEIDRIMSETGVSDGQQALQALTYDKLSKDIQKTMSETEYQELRNAWQRMDNVLKINGITDAKGGLANMLVVGTAAANVLQKASTGTDRGPLDGSAVPYNPHVFGGASRSYYTPLFGDRKSRIKTARDAKRSRK